MNQELLKKKRRDRRKLHIRKHVHGTAERLRLTVFKSLDHIYAQIINDDDMATLVSASTIDKDIKKLITPSMKKVDQSNIVGEILAKRAMEKKIKSVTFDRNGYLYRGRVKALADGSRKGGLEF
jgi:large subunit ribosomal protein L18